MGKYLNLTVSNSLTILNTSFWYQIQGNRKRINDICTFLSIDIKKLKFPIEFVQREPLPPETLPPPPSVWLAESDIALLPFQLS